MHKVTWQPGEEGKGVVDSYTNDVHVWNEDEFPLHHHFLQANPHIQPSAYFYTRPNGAIELTHPHPRYDDPAEVEAMHDLILPVDPHFHVESTDWDF